MQLLLSVFYSFKSSPALPVLIVNGKQTWLAVPNGDSNPSFSFFSLGSEKKTLKNKSRSRAIQIVFYLLFSKKNYNNTANCNQHYSIYSVAEK